MNMSNLMILSRLYHATSVCCMVKVNKLPKVMNKFMKGSKRKWYTDEKVKPILPSASGVADTKKENSRTANRRMTVLNKLFIRHISDQMCTGEIAEMLQGEDVQITKLKITHDFCILNIYWTTGNILEIEATEGILQKIAGILRHELSQLKLMGNVPKIFFLRDKSQLMINELDLSLSQADFGEDYQPIHYSKLKSDFVSSAPIKSNILEKLEELEATEDIQEEQIPDMNQNVFGLDRERIMNNILTSKNKSTEAWKRCIPKSKSENDDEEIKEDYKFAQKTSQTKINFHDFLKQRKVMQKKLKEASRADENTVEDDSFDEQNNEDDEFEMLFYEEEFENEIQKENE